MNTNINLSLSPLATTTFGYTVIPVNVGEKTIWCIRTRQDIPRDILTQHAPRMIVEDPQAVIPSGQNDLPFAFMAELLPDGTKNIVKLTDQDRFRTISFAKDQLFAVTTDGNLVTSLQIKDILRDHPKCVEYTKIDMRGLPKDAEVTSMLTIPTATGTKLLIGATTTKTNYWLFEGIVDKKNTRVVDLKPIEGQFSQIVGMRLGHDEKTVLLTTGDATVWGSTSIEDHVYKFKKLYGFHVNLDDNLVATKAGRSS